MGILVSALGRARQQARGIVCKSNLRQIGFAAYLYAEKWNWYIPRGTSGPTDKTWFQLFMPYLSQRAVDGDYRSVKIFRCPGYPNKEQTVCFVNNGWEFDGPADTVGHPIDEPTNVFGLRRLDRTIYLADNEDGPWRNIITHEGEPGWDMCDVWSADHLPRETNLQRRVARTRHSKGAGKPGCNVLYFDWHADWVGADDMTMNMWRFYR
jgi:prepilin-type processing-associated H-X9-DG protein